MAGSGDRRWPGAEAVMAAAVGIAREAARAGAASSPAEPERAAGTGRRQAAPLSRAELVRERAVAHPGTAGDVGGRAEVGRDPEPPVRRVDARPGARRPPDRTLAAVRQRGGPLRRAARRVGGPFWGVRLTMSLIIAFMLLTVTGFAFERLTGVDVLPNGPAARFWPAPRDFPVLSRSLPVSIRANAVRISAPIHGVGDTRGGAIEVPTGERFDEAGWYEKGPTPGEYGPAVIVGHADSGDGPSVFHKLSRLRPGNRVEITRADGSVAVFEVNTVKRYDRDDLPADEVFGDFSRPGLRLITCGGRWVGGTTGYADNVVVFASLVKARPASR